METLLKKDISANIGTQKYYVEVNWRNGKFVMDEPEELGGKDIGPDPYTTLLASLAGCTLSTLRMYISKKEWNVPEIKVVLNMRQELEPLHTIIKREIYFPNLKDDAIKKRLLIIAQKCPVSKILENKISINTIVP
jgi:putative redox protein